jgi:hypothetical protein
VPAAALYAWVLLSRVRSDLPFSLRPAAKALAAAVVFVPLILFSPEWPLSAPLFVAGAAMYAGLLLRLRVVTVAEISEVRRILGAQIASGEPQAQADRPRPRTPV